jgi:hypothetical protein
VTPSRLGKLTSSPDGSAGSLARELVTSSTIPMANKIRFMFFSPFPFHRPRGHHATFLFSASMLPVSTREPVARARFLAAGALMSRPPFVISVQVLTI